MTRREMKELAKQRLAGNWGTAILTMLIVYVINAFASAAFGILELIIAGPITIGLVSVFLNFFRKNDKVDFDSLFIGFNDFADNFIVGLLVYVFTFLWSLLFVIPGIVASYAYSMTFFIKRDHPEMHETEAITASKNMMKGHKWDLFMLDLSFLGWYILVGLTFGILILYVGPYHQAARTAFYLDLIGEKVCEDAAETAPEGEDPFAPAEEPETVEEVESTEEPETADSDESTDSSEGDQNA